MCLYPKLILNRKYTPTKKNGYNPPICKDERVKYVPIGCGKCIECLKQKARGWQVRMHEELKISKNGKFVTLTFNDEELDKLCKELGTKESNAVATFAMRRFNERYRKKHKVAVKHWVITELGHPPHSERIHMHGILFTDESNEELERLWKYGKIWFGDYVNNQTVNYMIKYVTKLDPDHKNYVPIILCSPGIGRNYTNTYNFKKNKYKGKDTKQNYTLPDGHIVNLPIYYRNKAYTEEERESLWLQLLDQEKRFVRGVEIDISTKEGCDMYERVLKTAQEFNKRLGYGSDEEEWQQKEYNVTVGELRKQTKIAKYRLQNAKK